MTAANYCLHTSKYTLTALSPLPPSLSLSPPPPPSPLPTCCDDGLITLSLMVDPSCDAFSLALVAQVLALLVKLLQPADRESQALDSCF